MKRRIFFILIILLAFTLSACDENGRYERLLENYQEHLDNEKENYQAQIDYFNALSSEVIESAVSVYNTVSGRSGASSGSGVVFLEDETHYYALTNNHVIYVEPERSNFYRVNDYLGNEYSATLVAQDANYDLAVIKFLKDKDVPLRLIEFALDNPIAGDNIALIGYPARQINAITLGKVTGYQRISLSDSNPDIVDINFDVISMDAPVKGGSSGSLVVNENFKLVGILFAGTRTGTNFTQSYAVPLLSVFEFLAKHEIGGETDENDA
jgi:serine protease Do